MRTHFDSDELAAKKTCGGQGRASGAALQDSSWQTKCFCSRVVELASRRELGALQFLRQGVGAMINELGQPI